MKIITWNACCKFREKYSLLSQYDADILVIQECEDPSRSLCQAYRAFSGQYVWVGANKNKGLGIFCKPGLQMDSLRKLFKTPISERWGKQICLNE